jgi:hypothetical protein
MTRASCLVMLEEASLPNHREQLRRMSTTHDTCTRRFGGTPVNLLGKALAIYRVFRGWVLDCIIGLRSGLWYDMMQLAGVVVSMIQTQEPMRLDDVLGVNWNSHHALLR